jgi:hypothetical protein
VRAEAQDMFGLGSREAVLAALVRGESRGFGAPAPAEDVADALGRVVPHGTVAVVPAGRVDLTLPAAPERTLGALEERATTAAFALGWSRDPRPTGESAGGALRFVPVSP